MMLICIKQQLSNIWSSIHEKVKQHWGSVKKKTFCLYKSVHLLHVFRILIYFQFFLYGTSKSYISYFDVCFIFGTT